MDNITDQALYLIGRQEINAKRNRGPMLTFIDDDANAAFPASWEAIITDKQIEMNCAVITNKVDTQFYMSWETLERLSALGVETASHSHTHANLRDLTDIQMRGEFELSQAALRAHGLPAEVLVYPYGQQDLRVRQLAKQYFRAGVVAGGEVPNTPPIKSFALDRVHLDDGPTPTFEFFKGVIDTAIAQNGWIIFMSHSHNPTFDDDIKTVIRQIIDYARANSVAILPVSKALDRIGNVIEAGESTIRDFGAYFIVDCDGLTYSGNIASYHVDTSTDVTITTPSNYFMINRLHRVRISSSQSQGFPSSNGILDTWRDATSNYRYQIFYSTASTRVYRRIWLATEGAWGPFVRISSDVWRLVKTIDFTADTAGFDVRSDAAGIGFSLTRAKVRLLAVGAQGGTSTTRTLYLNGTGSDNGICTLEQQPQGESKLLMYSIENVAGWWDIQKSVITPSGTYPSGAMQQFSGKMTPAPPITRLYSSALLGAGSRLEIYGIDA